MTNELEKQFFQCFGIEPNCQNTFINPSKCPFNESRECCDCVSFEYPQISDRILLELIIILGTICTVFDKNIDDLKENVLKNLIELSGRYHIYNQVRTLFEEGNNDRT
jgi:hypothetical protein